MPSIIRGTDTFDSAVKVYGFKNHLINGNFDIWQRGTSQTTDGYGSDDRWFNGNIGSTKTHSRVVCTDTERVLFNASAFSRTVVTSVAGAGNYTIKYQHIEDVTKLAGKTVTVSFWAKADSNKNLSFNIAQDFGTGGSPSAISYYNAVTVNITSSWQKITATFNIPSIVGKTLGTDGIHTTSTMFLLQFDAGATAVSSYFPTSTVGQQSGTFDIAQVQLEEGSVATPFEQRHVGLELSLCQRYYEKFVVGYLGNANLGSYYGGYSTFKDTKRVTPTIAFILGSNFHGFDGTNPGIAAYVGNDGGGWYKPATATVPGASFSVTLSASAEL